MNESLASVNMSKKSDDDDTSSSSGAVSSDISSFDTFDKKSKDANTSKRVKSPPDSVLQSRTFNIPINGYKEKKHKSKATSVQRTSAQQSNDGDRSSRVFANSNKLPGGLISDGSISQQRHGGDYFGKVEGQLMGLMS